MKVANKEKSYQWLEKTGLRDSTEALIIAAQEQALSTRSIEAGIYHTRQDPRCKLCSETIQHIVAGCKMQAGTAYTKRHNQSESLVVCEVEEQLVEKLKKFRFRKETSNAAIIMKIDKDRRLVVLEEEHEYQHEDGRVSYPLCFIFSSPVGCKPEQQMMYAGSKNKLVQKAELTKVFEIRNTEDLTEEWLIEKLGFFH
ncbi:unnamed protein product [Ranitomeya imitator]|uniref:Glia maturation factor beta n=1 Tax=Ranitomeya imitator TaxID=111125 RepID=A0ABN9LF01_9NEOB|nr:unnamed protein product [Ranitomeya imitator]